MGRVATKASIDGSRRRFPPSWQRQGQQSAEQLAIKPGDLLDGVFDVFHALGLAAVIELYGYDVYAPLRGELRMGGGIREGRGDEPLLLGLCY
jgi:hypothetical protein